MPLLFTFWLALLPFFKSAAPEASVTADNYCRIYGSVYLERDPKYRNAASHTVFLNEEEAFADMVVYRESNKLFADATDNLAVSIRVTDERRVNSSCPEFPEHGISGYVVDCVDFSVQWKIGQSINPFCGQNPGVVVRVD